MLSKRLLVVEDEEIILADLLRTLRKQGYEVAGTASSGAAAIRAVEILSPDVVLIDVRLRGQTDGIEAARRIWKACDAAIIFVTAHAGALSLEVGALPGRYGSVSKPFSPTHLRRAIESLVHA